MILAICISVYIIGLVAFVIWRGCVADAFEAWADDYWASVIFIGLLWPVCAAVGLAVFVPFWLLKRLGMWAYDKKLCGR